MYLTELSVPFMRVYILYLGMMVQPIYQVICKTKSSSGAQSKSKFFSGYRLSLRLTHTAVTHSDSTHVGLGYLSVFPKTGRPGGLELCWNLFLCPCGTHIMTRIFGREKRAELGISRG